jgi:hypothetical protein
LRIYNFIQSTIFPSLRLGAALIGLGAALIGLGANMRSDGGGERRADHANNLECIVAHIV